MIKKAYYQHILIYSHNYKQHVFDICYYKTHWNLLSIIFRHYNSNKSYNLKKYDLHLIMQELGKFNFKINVISNGLEKYMNFSINNKLSFIDSFQFLSYSLDNLVKNLAKDDLKYLRQEFDKNVLDLVKQK